MDGCHRYLSDENSTLLKNSTENEIKFVLNDAIDENMSEKRIKTELIDDNDESNQIKLHVIKVDVDSNPKRSLGEFDTYLKCSVDLKNECDVKRSNEPIKKELSDANDTIDQIEIQDHEIKLEYNPESSQSQDLFPKSPLILNNEKEHDDSLLKLNEGHPSEKKNFICDKCPYATKYRSNFHRHQSAHSGIQPYSCDLCSFSSAYSNSLKIHKATHNPERHTGDRAYSCKLCSFSAIHKHNLTNHMKSVHSDERPYVCDECPYKAKLRDYLTRHKRIVHKCVRIVKNNDSDQINNGNASSGLKIHDKNLSDSNDAIDEIDIQNHEVKLECNTESLPESLDSSPESQKKDDSLNEQKDQRLNDNTAVNRKSEKNYTCDKCSYKTKYRSNLYRHETVHTGVQPYSCDLCSFSSAYSQSVRIHKAIHDEERNTPYSCELCSYSTIHKHRLKFHMKSIHSDERPYACDQCSYTAKLKNYITRHKIVVHKSVRYSCEVCSYSTDERRFLKKHMEIEHNQHS